MTEYMVLAGTGETQNLDCVPAKLLRQKYGIRSWDKITIVHYENSIGPANQRGDKLDWRVGLQQAISKGVMRLREAIRKTNSVPVLVGYSLGAYVVTEFLEGKSEGHFQYLQIRGAILIANPRAALNGQRQGIAGPHGKIPRGVFEINNYNDMICRTPKGSFLTLVEPGVMLATGIADGTMSPVSPGAMKILNEMLIKASVTQPSLSIDRELRLINGYLSGKEHVQEYFVNSVLVRAGREAVSSFS